MKMKWLSLLLAFTMLTAVLNIALAEGNDPVTDPAKVLTVNAADDRAEGEYATIQAAIDFVANLPVKEQSGWTFNVKNGTYDRFTVPLWRSDKNGNVTADIRDWSFIGESEEGVIVNVLYSTEETDHLIDKNGINIYGKNILLKNMTIKAGNAYRYRLNSDGANDFWADAAISTNHGMSGGKNISLTVDNCTLVGPGIGKGATFGIFWACSGMSVTDCNISGFANAIEFMNDGFNVPAGETYKFTGNTITGASFAFHGYMGGGNGEAEKGGTLLFANNTVTGTKDLRSKVICQDNVKNSFIVDIHDNTLTNAFVALVMLRGEGDVVSPVLTSNNFGDNSFYVEADWPGTIDFFTTYSAPASAYGKWHLTGNDSFSDEAKKYIQELMDQINANPNSNVLSITGIDSDHLIETFTAFKDAIYWETLPTPTPKPTPRPTPRPTAIPTATPTATPDMSDLPETGDNSHFEVFAALLFVSFAGMLLLKKRSA